MDKVRYGIIGIGKQGGGYAAALAKGKDKNAVLAAVCDVDKVKLVNADGQLRTAKVGFSWTTFFFGFLVPIFRGDAKWAVIMFIASIFTLFLAQIVLSFTYNGTYVRELLSKGYRPEDEYSRAVLVAKGYIAG